MKPLRTNKVIGAAAEFRRFTEPATYGGVR
jgi:hypothetical protein